MHHPIARTGVTLLILGIVILLSIPNPAHSQYIPCNIVNLVVTHPDSVSEGQTLQVMTSFTGSCDPSAFYYVRVDLVDQRSGTVLSSVKLPYYPTTSGVMNPINNTATAPMSIGPWVLQTQVYLITGINGQVAGSSQQEFVVNVTQYVAQYTAQNTTTTAVFSAENTTQVVAFSTVSNQTIFSSSNSTFSVTPMATTSGATNQSTNLIIEALTLLLVGGAAVFFVAMWRKRPAAPPTQTEPKTGYCTQCGTKLIANETVCGKCGAKIG